MSSQPIRGQVEVEVRYAETDQMQVVHHANYLVWFELARTDLCAKSGYHYAAIEQLGFFLMVTGAEVRYRRGARYGDRVTVSVWIDRLGSRGLKFAYEVNRDDELLATGATEHVWVDAATGGLRRMPEALNDSFLRLAGKTPTG